MKSMAEERRLLAEIKALRTENRRLESELSDERRRGNLDRRYLDGEIERVKAENVRLRKGLQHVRNVHASITGMRELFPEHTELGAIQGQLELVAQFAGMEDRL